MAVSEKKTRILNAAKECFSRYGYDKTTLEDIGKAVGLNKASLYYYFKNKDSIFAAVIIDEADRLLESLREKLSHVTGGCEKILTYLEEKLKYFQEVTHLLELTMDIIRNVQPFFKDLYQELNDKERTFLAEILNTSIRAGEINQCDTLKVAEAFILIFDTFKFNSMMCDGTAPGNKLDFHANKDTLLFTAGLILEGLKKQNE